MTKIAGILNLTPDSFSDGGKYSGSAWERINQLIEEGADIIDIGAQSTRPGAEIISQNDEWLRLEPVLKKIRENNIRAEISIDSFNPETIGKALSYDITYINDVSGFSSPEMISLAAESGKKIICMHNLGVPADKAVNVAENENVIGVLSSWLEEKISSLFSAGISKENIIFDPGIGFGKTKRQDLEIIMNFGKFKKYGVEILIGHSRKSFLSLFTENPPEERDGETAIFSYLMIQKNIDYLRVHNVAATKKLIL